MTMTPLIRIHLPRHFLPPSQHPTQPKALCVRRAATDMRHWSVLKKDT